MVCERRIDAWASRNRRNDAWQERGVNRRASECFSPGGLGLATAGRRDDSGGNR
jgi:hypothetical protein